jgi:hypothetical protein
VIQRDHQQTEELFIKTAVGIFLDSITHGRAVDSDRREIPSDTACAFSWPLAMAKGDNCSGIISDSRRG